jgi:hypothetical protein
MGEAGTSADFGDILVEEEHAVMHPAENAQNRARTLYTIL